MAIRRANPGDLSDILRISGDGFFGDDPIDAAWLVGECSKPGTLLQVEDAGAGCIRGFLLTHKYTGYSIIRLIAVDPKFRRQGVGRGLLAKVRGKAGAWVREENEASRTMFERAGWRVSVPKWTEAEKPQSHSGNWIYFARG